MWDPRRLTTLQHAFTQQRVRSRLPRGTLYPQKFALTSLTGGGRSVCIVRSRTRATEFSFLVSNEHLATVY
jgi:hypothetical protein